MRQLSDEELDAIAQEYDLATCAELAQYLKPTRLAKLGATLIWAYALVWFALVINTILLKELARALWRKLSFLSK